MTILNEHEQPFSDFYLDVPLVENVGWQDSPPVGPQIDSVDIAEVVAMKVAKLAGDLAAISVVRAGSSYNVNDFDSPSPDALFRTESGVYDKGAAPNEEEIGSKRGIEVNFAPPEIDSVRFNYDFQIDGLWGDELVERVGGVEVREVSAAAINSVVVHRFTNEEKLTDLSDVESMERITVTSGTFDDDDNAEILELEFYPGASSAMIVAIRGDESSKKHQKILTDPKQILFAGRSAMQTIGGLITVLEKSRRKTERRMN